jgi:NDP-sugar pyrophosphorylase family protein
MPVGGEGTRLRPITQCTPKCFVNLSGKRLIELNLEVFIQAGIRNFLFCGVGERSMFEDIAASINQHDCHVGLSFETERTGNMGAFLSEESPFAEMQILVSFGDILVEQETIETLLAAHDLATDRITWLFSRSVDQKLKHRFCYDEKTGSLSYEGKGPYSANSISPTGLFVASFKSLLDCKKRFGGNDFLFTILLPLVREGSGMIAPCTVDQEVVDINEPVDLAAAHALLSNQDLNLA